RDGRGRRARRLSGSPAASLRALFLGAQRRNGPGPRDRQEDRRGAWRRDFGGESESGRASRAIRSAPHGTRRGHDGRRSGRVPRRRPRRGAAVLALAFVLALAGGACTRPKATAARRLPPGDGVYLAGGLGADPSETEKLLGKGAFGHVFLPALDLSAAGEW